MKEAGILLTRRSIELSAGVAAHGDRRDRTQQEALKQRIARDQSNARFWLEEWGKASSTGHVFINVEHRYRSASTELNQRMAGRHSTYLGFAVATGAFISLLLNRKSEGLTHTLIIFPSVICFAFSAWIRSQDLTVGLLSAYCRVCERWDNQTWMPSFYSEDQGWWKRAMRYREWMELSFVVIALILVESPVVLDYGTRPPTTLIPWFFLNQFVFGVCSWMILSIRLQRYRMFDIEIVPIVHLGDETHAGEIHFGVNEDIDENPKARPFLIVLFLSTVSILTFLVILQSKSFRYFRDVLEMIIASCVLVKLYSTTIECCYLKKIISRNVKVEGPTLNWWRKMINSRFFFILFAGVLVYFEGSNLPSWLYAFRAISLTSDITPEFGSIFNPSHLGSFAALMVAGYALPELLTTLRRRRVCDGLWIGQALKFAFDPAYRSKSHWRKKTNRSYKVFLSERSERS